MKNFDFEKVPIVEVANTILLDGVKKGASDIHFDPTKDSLKIRMRVDGILYDYSVIPGDFKKNIISRIKMIASMNIMETRLPQDGAIKSKIGDKILDLRVSSLPTNCGEKVVLRILDYSKSNQGLESLGFSKTNYDKILKMTAVPNGIVLVTGATGSGKSTTVYSLLQKLNTSEVNIITVEDPVEMDVEGINQVQAQAEIGLDFASVLRSILRQDPDIIMIGEIRDGETAKIAVRASITGHKVLSTIHTNSALNTIERLTDMEVERYLIGTSLNGVISQKLARKMCPHCRKLRDTTDYEKSLFKRVLNKDISQVYDINPDGCDECFKGFKGRLCIAEVLMINDEIRTAITNSVSKDQMRDLVYNLSGTHTLLEDGLEKVLEGETSFDEVIKTVDLENDLAIHDAKNKKNNMSETINDNQNKDESNKSSNEDKNLLLEIPLENINNKDDTILDNENKTKETETSDNTDNTNNANNTDNAKDADIKEDELAEDTENINNEDNQSENFNLNINENLDNVENENSENADDIKEQEVAEDTEDANNTEDTENVNNEDNQSENFNLNINENLDNVENENSENADDIKEQEVAEDTKDANNTEDNENINNEDNQSEDFNLNINENVNSNYDYQDNSSDNFELNLNDNINQNEQSEDNDNNDDNDFNLNSSFDYKDEEKEENINNITDDYTDYYYNSDDNNY